MKIFITQNKKSSKLAIAFLWLLLWQILYIMIGKEILFVSPFGVLKTLGYFIKEAAFWQTVFTSVLRIFFGFFIAAILGTFFAVLTFFVPFLYDFFQPFFHVIKATPVASFIILALVWLKTDTIPVFISGLMVFPGIWNHILEGFKMTDKKLLEMAQIYQFSFFQKIRLLYLPSAYPYFLSAFSSGIGLAWKSGVAAEVICNPKFSIGSQLYLSKIYLETPELFAWTTVVILLSVLFEKALLKLLESKSGRFMYYGE